MKTCSSLAVSLMTLYCKEGNLSKASEILTKANKLTAQYEQELSNVRKEAQLEITNSQKIHKEILDIELNISQKYIDNLCKK